MFTYENSRLKGLKDTEGDVVPTQLSPQCGDNLPAV